MMPSWLAFLSPLLPWWRPWYRLGVNFPCFTFGNQSLGESIITNSLSTSYLTIFIPSGIPTYHSFSWRTCRLVTMPYGALPTTESPAKKRAESSPPSKVAAHIINQLRRPTRIRRRAILGLVTLGSLILIFLGKHNAVRSSVGSLNIPSTSG
jgi:hypothetical protein